MDYSENRYEWTCECCKKTFNQRIELNTLIGEWHESPNCSSRRTCMECYAKNDFLGLMIKSRDREQREAFFIKNGYYPYSDSDIFVVNACERGGQA